MRVQYLLNDERSGGWDGDVADRGLNKDRVEYLCFIQFKCYTYTQPQSTYSG